MLKFLTHIIYADRHKLYFILFVYLQEELENGEDVARCPSCSLIVQVIYDLVSYFEVTSKLPLGFPLQDTDCL